MPAAATTLPAKERTKPNRLKLTQLAVERMGPPAQGYLTVWDVHLPGFGLRISAMTGRKSWVAMYRVAGGKEVMETIGSVALIPSLAEARKRARESMDQARQGIHPVKARKQKQAEVEAKAAADAYTLERLVEDFVNRHHKVSSRASTVYEARRLCRRALPYLGDKPVATITKSDILGMVRQLADTRVKKWRGKEGGSLSEASGVLRHLRSCFKWAVDEDLIASDPTAGVRDPLPKKSERERVLNDDEIKALWQICSEIGFPYGPLVKLLLLTGQRLREVGDLTWHELNLPRRIWTLPSTRAKNGRTHGIHLSDLTLEVIAELPRFDEHDFLFSVNGVRPVQSFPDAKIRINKRLAELFGHVEPWTYHDLRRTMATGMADLGIAPHVLDRILNHTSGSISGVARIYNRSEYRLERMAALDTWGRHLEGLVYPQRTRQNIIAMPVR